MIVILFSRLSLFSHRLIPAPVQEQPDAHRDEEYHPIVNEHIDSVIVRLEQQDDEQVIEHDGDQHPCNSDTGIVLQGEAFPLPEPPRHNHDSDRGEDGKENPAHDSRIRREEQNQRCEITDQPEGRA